MAYLKINQAAKSNGNYPGANVMADSFAVRIGKHINAVFAGIHTPMARSLTNLFLTYTIVLLLVLFTGLLVRNQLVSSPENIQALTSVPFGLTADTGISKVVQLAEAFKATLTDEQITVLQLAYSKKDAASWSNFPQAFSHPKRVGLGLGSLNQKQLSAAKVLIAAVLSHGSMNEGYDEFEGTLAADDYFGKTTGQTSTFGSGNYYIAFLGKPSVTALWELQFGGHHYAFADTYNGGKITGVTPSFRGVEPMAAVAANGRSYQPVEQERAAFSGLIEALTDDQKKAAKLSSTFSDILLGPGQDGNFPKSKQGLKVGDLNKKQQQLVSKAISLYVDDLDPETAKPVMTKYLAGLPDTYVSYSGSGTMSQSNDYIRLDGPNIWIEYSVQPSRDFPNTTHPHSVWRDRTGDYGGN